MSIRLQDIPPDSFDLLVGENLETVTGWLVREGEETLRAFSAEHGDLLVLVAVVMGPMFHLAAFDCGDKSEAPLCLPVAATWEELMDWHRAQMDRLGLWNTGGGGSYEEDE